MELQRSSAAVRFANQASLGQKGEDLRFSSPAPNKICEAN